MKTVSMCICRHASCHISKDLIMLTHLQCDLTYMARFPIILRIKNGLKIYVIFFFKCSKLGMGTLPVIIWDYDL